METKNSVLSLVELVDAEDITTEKIRCLDSPLEINNVTSKVLSQNLSSEIFDSNPVVLFTQTRI